MPFIVQTPPSHPGIRRYVGNTATTQRRSTYQLVGSRALAIEFPNRASAGLAINHFSSLYGLEIIEVKNP